MPEEKNIEEEINLRDYINIIIKRKKIILILFIASIVITALLSFLQPKVFQASVSIMITPSWIQTNISPTQIYLDSEKLAATAGNIAPKPAFSLSTHKLLLKSNAVLERVINRLRLTNKDGKKLMLDDIIDKLNIKETKNTNILELQIKDTQPKQAMDLANAWAQEYIVFSQELILGEIKGTREFITDQFEIARKNLIEAEEKVKDFKEGYSLDLMRAELEIKKSKINEFKKELIEAALKTKMDNLTAETDINALKHRLEYLEKAISSTELEANELGKNINQREFDLIQLERQVEIYKKTYDNLFQKIEEVRLVKAAQLGEVRILSSAIEPKLPIGPNMSQNVAISGIIGLITGMFLAFFQEFWEKEKERQGTKKA